MLNNNTLINLEMQVANQFNWPERSLSYLSNLAKNTLTSISDVMNWLI